MVAYHDIFRYPVTATEIHRFLGHCATEEQLSIALDEMLGAKLLYRNSGYYSLHNDVSILQRRCSGNARAAQLLPIGYRIGRLLGKFPFVRGVGISGSLSKDFADEQADIDFFIITKANRLWIARTLLHCLKKLSFLAGKQHWFCMNYFIDEEALVMPEQNLFIATEVVTLKPVSGQGLDTFFSANSWAAAYFPNKDEYAISPDLPTGSNWFKKSFEWCFSGSTGEWFDNKLMQITQQRWQRKEHARKLNSKGFPLSLRIAKHYGRPNPEHLQRKILSLLDEKMKSMPQQKTLADIVSIPPHFLRREII